MTDRPEDRPEERRRTGPLGDEDSEATQVQPSREQPSQEQQETSPRESPQNQDTGQAETRQIRTDQTEESSDEERRSSRFRRSSRRRRDEDDADDKETRVIRTPGSGTQGSGTRSSGATAESPYPRGYFEAAEEREDRLRDMYGGVDWLASFLGFVFAGLVGALLAVILGLILVPLGISLAPASGNLGAATITGLVVLGILIFLTYFFGGYVAGRLARFDGGRNGALLLLWSLLGAALLILAGGILNGILPGDVSTSIRDFLQETVLPTIGGILALGIIGIIVLVAALLIALLGGFLGGRAGSRYHTEIDRTT